MNDVNKSGAFFRSNANDLLGRHIAQLVTQSARFGKIYHVQMSRTIAWSARIKRRALNENAAIMK